jgi:hypothetical protein
LTETFKKSFIKKTTFSKKVMECLNQNCGLKSTFDSKFCYQCNEIKKKQALYNAKREEHSHYRYDEEERFCNECSELLRLKSENDLCINCGNSSYYGHRLCRWCINNTRQCNNCNFRTKTYLKSCKDCSIKLLASSVECEYLKCSEYPKDGRFMCEKHSCGNKKCLNSINIDSEKYCSRCVCRMGRCREQKINKDWCDEHTCKSNNCEAGTTDMYCDNHECNFRGCENEVHDSLSDDANGGDNSDNSKKQYCRIHQCKVLNCSKEIKEHVKYGCGYRVIDTNYGEHCINHSCKVENCLNMKIKVYCANHCCIVKDCKKEGLPFICSLTNHLNPFYIPGKTQCREWHTSRNGSRGSYNFDDMMLLSKYLTFSHLKIDMKLMWLSLVSKIDLIDFVNGFKKSALIVLSGLKNNRVCKDIREIIYYEYLKRTIIHYFHKKCYDCVRICSQKKCGEVGWPYNENCKTHICSKYECHNLKYAPHNDSKNSLMKYVKNRNSLNVCLEHKCHRDCKNEVYNGTKFCNRHLCPLCRVGGTYKSNNFCKKCACKKKIPNEYGTVFCSNPKSFGSKDGFCSDHTQY